MQSTANQATAFDVRRLLVLIRLRALQTKGRLRRFGRLFRSPARAIPTLVACVVGVLWLANAGAALMLRAPADPQDFRRMVPWAMLFICAAKLVRILVNRDDCGVQLRGADVQWLRAGPFSVAGIRLYKTAGHAISIIITALMASVFLRADVHYWLAGFVGAALAMLAAHLIYMIVAVIAVNVTQAAYNCARIAVVLTGLIVLSAIVYQSGRGESVSQWFQSVGHVLTLWLQLPILMPVRLPFEPFAAAMCADSVSQLVQWTLACLAVIGGLTGVLAVLEPAMVARAGRRQRQVFLREMEAGNSNNAVVTTTTAWRAWTTWELPPFYFLRGVGPVFWRQAATLKHRCLGIPQALALLAMLAGGVLASTSAVESAQVAPLIATLSMLTFLFMPAALPYDFRRDIDQMTALKLLPLPTSSLILGQLALPVIITTVCQAVFLLTIAVMQPQLGGLLFIGWLFLLPANLVFFAVENLVFLFYPYRLSDFDLAATARRTLLLFTKLLLLFLASLAALLLAVMLGSTCRALGVGGNGVTILYGALCWCGVALTGTLCIRLNCWAFRRYGL